MIYTFIIKGNQEDENGNAIPKLRMTQNTKWTDQAKRYEAWKEYVRSCFYDSVKDNPKLQWKYARNEKPFGKESAFMTLRIVWANEKHGDPESIFGGIADALFENDKHLNGYFASTHSEGKIGLVAVEIEIL